MGEKMTTFDDLIARSAVHSDREAGLPGRPDPVDRVPCGCCARVPEMVAIEVSPDTYDRVLDLLLDFAIQGRDEVRK